MRRSWLWLVQQRSDDREQGLLTQPRRHYHPDRGVRGVGGFLSGPVAREKRTHRSQRLAGRIDRFPITARARERVVLPGVASWEVMPTRSHSMRGTLIFVAAVAGLTLASSAY